MWPGICTNDRKRWSEGSAETQEASEEAAGEDAEGASSAEARGEEGRQLLHQLEVRSGGVGFEPTEHLAVLSGFSALQVLLSGDLASLPVPEGPSSAFARDVEAGASSGVARRSFALPFAGLPDRRGAGGI